METALLQTQPSETDDRARRRTFWRGVARALKHAAISTGKGSAWLARTGYDNRHYVPAVVNGAVGDKLARRDGALAIRMSFRVRGRDVSPGALGQTLRDGNGHAVVFVHGLMANEVYWQEPFGDHDGMGPALAHAVGVTPLYVRYNSGAHISENGRDLAALLERLIDEHGDHIDRLTLVGHSMGGLVIRSAGHYGDADDHRWRRQLRSVVLLGAPNEGAYLEQIAHLTTRVLASISTHTRMIASVINERSAGIKDLRLGVLVDEDWQRDDDRPLRRAERTDVPPLPGVDYHVVAGTLTANHRSLIATWFGDGLVGRRSALGDHVRVRVFPRTGHLALVSRPDVQEHVAAAIRELPLLRA